MNEKIPIASELEISEEHLAEHVEIDRELVDIQTLCHRYVERRHPPKTFVPGKTYIPASGKVVGAPEALNMVDAALSLDLTIFGKWNAIFEKKLADYIDVKHVMTCNSGSSANLLAVSALMSPSLGDRALKPGDEVIVAACGFPTTVNPILQNGLVPVFVDSVIPYYHIDADKIVAAVSDKTKAIMLDHTLGNPCDMAKIREIADFNGLWIIEDCCDSLGSRQDGQHVGTFGDIGTLSFYPAHHITTGEGGAVFTNSDKLSKILTSLCNWGRHCVCPPNHDNVCGKRFDWQLGSLPYGWDHKYAFAELGYNFKMTDMQAACGAAQMDRMESFHKTRRDNFEYLQGGLDDLWEHLLLPHSLFGSDPSWFCFPLTLRNGERLPLLKHLEEKRIGTRLLFGGNLTRQPYMQDRTFRVSGDLSGADRIMCNSFCIGMFPGLGKPELDYVIEVLHSYFKR